MKDDHEVREGALSGEGLVVGSDQIDVVPNGSKRMRAFSLVKSRFFFLSFASF